MASREERKDQRNESIRFYLCRALDEVGNAEDVAMCGDDDILLGKIQITYKVVQNLLNEVRYGG